MTDPIADMLTRIRNALRVKKATVDVPCSTLKLAIAAILVREGYVVKADVPEGSRAIRLVLRYDEDGAPCIRHLRRISTPGRRVYVQNTDIPRVLGGLGIAIVSTSKGVMTDSEARKAKIGGELLCEID